MGDRTCQKGFVNLNVRDFSLNDPRESGGLVDVDANKKKILMIIYI